MVEPIEKPVLDTESAAISGDWQIALQSDKLLYPRDKILNQKGGGQLDLYEKIYQDPQVFALYQQRIMRRLAYPLEVKAGGEKRVDKNAAAWCQELIENLNFDEIDSKMSLAIHYGFSVAELMLTNDGSYTTLDLAKGGIRVRRRGRFRFDYEGGTRVLTRNNIVTGEVFPPSRLWKLDCGGTDSDDPYGQGLGHWLYWAHFCKHGGMPLWLNYLDGSATGVPLVTHGATATEAEKAAALQLAQALKNGRPSRKSEGFIAELLQATSSGTADYATLINLCDSWISKVILSQTMTSDSGASLSQALVHDDVALSVIRADSELICDSFSDQVLRRLCAWNFPDAMPPHLVRSTDIQEDLNVRADRDRKLYALGYRVTSETVNQSYGEGQYIDLQDLTQQPQEQIALNGEQAKALIEMVALSANLTPQASMAIAKAAFPQLPDELVAKIFSAPPVLPPQDAQVPNQLSAQDQGQTKPPVAAFSEIRSGEIYEFLEKKLDTVDKVGDRLMPTLGKHLDKWQSAIQKAQQESSDFVEFQERIAAIYEGMAKSREALSIEAAKAFRLANLSGIYEAEQDGN